MTIFLSFCKILTNKDGTMNEQQHNQILDSIISLNNKLVMMIAIINGEARNSKLGVNATITDKASTRKGNTVAQERHGNDISREQ